MSETSTARDDVRDDAAAADGDRARRARSFGAVAREYDRLRPRPVADAVSWAVPAGARRVLDLAAGTGLMTRALRRAGLDVVAVEPDEAMRAVLVERSPEVEALAGVGEDVPLPDACVDAVVVSSAWHWVDPVRGAGEVARVLRDGGRFTVLWTSPDREVDWVRELRVGGRPSPGPAADDGGAQGRARELELPDGSPFTAVEGERFTALRSVERSDLLDLLGTYSTTITGGQGVLAAARDHADQVLTARFGDAQRVELPVRSRCWRTTRLPRG